MKQIVASVGAKKFNGKFLMCKNMSSSYVKMNIDVFAGNLNVNLIMCRNIHSSYVKMNIDVFVEI